MEGVRNVEPLQEDCGVAFRRVPVFFADDALELAEAHAGLVGHLGLRVELVAFEEGVPQTVVTHDDRIDDAMLVERELILLQDAEFRGPHDGTLLGIELAGEQFHEGGFAGPVRARQAVPPARRKGRRHVLEERLRAVTHSDAAYRNHDLPILTEQTFFTGVHEIGRRGILH